MPLVLLWRCLDRDLNESDRDLKIGSLSKFQRDPVRGRAASTDAGSEIPDSFPVRDDPASEPNIDPIVAMEVGDLAILREVSEVGSPTPRTAGEPRDFDQVLLEPFSEAHRPAHVQEMDKNEWRSCVCDRMNPRPTRQAPMRFKVDFESCPVEASLGVLGRKYALLVLRDIALYQAQRFTQMMRATPGLTKRVLSMRLHELEQEGLIVRVVHRHKYTKWRLTEKGLDVLPILMTLVQFGSTSHADRVFADRRARSLREVFEVDYIRKVLGEPLRPRARRGITRAVFDVSRTTPGATVAAAA